MAATVPLFFKCLPLRGPKKIFKILESYKYRVINNYLGKERL
jgi:hypothetical protein